MHATLPSAHLRAAKQALGRLSTLAPKDKDTMGWSASWHPDLCQVEVLDRSLFAQSDTGPSDRSAHAALAWQGHLARLEQAMGALHALLSAHPGTGALFDERHPTLVLTIRGHSQGAVGLTWGTFDPEPYRGIAPPDPCPCGVRDAGAALDAAMATEGNPIPHLITSVPRPAAGSGWHMPYLTAPTATLRALLPLVGGARHAKLWILDTKTSG